MISTVRSEKRLWKMGTGKKGWFLLLMAMLLLGRVSSVQASQNLNIYLDKDALLRHEAPAEDIRICPEGMVRVTRQALWPWDDEGKRWSIFVEIENISDEKIIIDEDWLVACRANRHEIDTADYVFSYMTNIIAPGEKTVLYAGSYPHVRTKGTNADAALDVWDVEGMEDFAGRIRRAELLRVRLEVRGYKNERPWPAVPVSPKVWVEDGVLYFEWTNDTDEKVDFRTIGAVMCDKEGRMFDVICSSYSRGASAAPGETLRFEKELPPYITQEMTDEAVFEAYAYRMRGK